MGGRTGEGKRATEVDQADSLHEKLSKRDSDANDNSSYLHSLVEFALRRIFCRCSRPVRGGDGREIAVTYLHFQCLDAMVYGIL
jgi:hypothetical protein